MRAMVIGIIVHKSMWPNCAPAWEYVRMPPASLSTFAVIKPGPTTEKNSRIWVFQRLRNCMRAVHGMKFTLWTCQNKRCGPFLNRRKRPGEKKLVIKNGRSYLGGAALQ